MRCLTTMSAAALATLSSTLLAAVVAAQPPPASPIATATLVVQGRLVDADDRTPLRHCRVRLTGHQSTGYPISWARTDWADPEELTTGDDGRFRFEVRLPAADEELDRARYHLNVSHPRHCAWFSHCAFVVATRRGGIDYGDVRLPKGVRPRLRVEDADGALQPGVLVQLLPKARPAEFVQIDDHGPHSWVESGLYARTDIDGYLHPSDPIPAGDYTVQVRGRTARAVPDVVTLPSGDPIVAVVETLDDDDVVAGRVVDADGRPFGGVLLQASTNGGASTATQRDGRFTLVRTDADAGARVRVRMALNRRYDRWADLGDVAWGTRDHEFAVPAVAVRTFVVRTADGAPIELFNLHCVPAGRGAPQAGVRLSGAFAGGRATARLASGVYALLVAPHGGEAVATDWREIQLDDGDAELEVVVPAGVERRIEVRRAGEGGGPVAGARIEVVVGARPPDDGFVRPATVVRDPSSPPPERLLVAAAVTDAQGRATVRLREAGEVHLRVSGAGLQNAVHTVDLRRGGAPTTITAAAGASIVGTLGPVDRLRALDPRFDPDARPSIYAYHSRYAPTLLVVGDTGVELRREVLLDEQGRFRCDGLPAGAVEVQLQVWGAVGANRMRVAPSPIPLGAFLLEVGVPLEVELELPADATGTRDGR